MDMMSVRRRVLMGQKSGSIDTTPIIDLYDTGLGRYNYPQTGSNVGYCVTIVYPLPDPSIRQRLKGSLWTSQGFIQYMNSDMTPRDWWYITGQDGERSLAVDAYYARFELLTEKIDDAYCYEMNTGYIIFAGRNTQYYGHKNVSELS